MGLGQSAREMGGKLASNDVAKRERKWEMMMVDNGREKKEQLWQENREIYANSSNYVHKVKVNSREVKTSIKI